MTIQKSPLAQLLTSLSLIALLAPTKALAQTPQVWSGVCVEQEVATIQGLQCLLANVLTVAVTVIGLAGFVMLLYGSFRYMFSGGNSKGTENARNTITFAVVGLVVALAAYIILNLISSFTGVTSIKIFRIPDSNTGL